MPTTKKSGADILALAEKHVGEKYVLGVLVPKNNDQWKGPWDCAEFVSWTVYQTAHILYGCEKTNRDPATANAYTGFWADDAGSRGKEISLEEAARTPGAAVLRIPQAGATGHIVISDGEGGTVEAHSSLRGVIKNTLSERRWDMGILVPGITYTQNPDEVVVDGPSTIIYRLKKPRMTGSKVEEIQEALKDAGFDPGGIDGNFGPMTQAAVVAFQISKKLVADGEVGPLTAKKLGISL